MLKCQECDEDIREDWVEKYGDRLCKDCYIRYRTMRRIDKSKWHMNSQERASLTRRSNPRFHRERLIERALARKDDKS